MSRLHTADSPTMNPIQNGRETAKPCEPANGKPAETRSADASSTAQAAAGAKEAENKESTSRVERAEAITDRIAVGVAMFTSSVGRSIVRIASSIGETLADTWAEAQSIRRGKKK